MAKINICENCSQPYPPDWGDLSRVDNLADRIAPGERVPSGQCGECGALVHLREVCELGTQRKIMMNLGMEYVETDNSWTPANIVVSGSGCWVSIRVHVPIEELDIYEEDDDDS